MDEKRLLSAVLVAVVVTMMLILFAWKHNTTGIGEIREGVRDLKKAVEMVK